jgi:hypothetical protein
MQSAGFLTGVAVSQRIGRCSQNSFGIPIEAFSVSSGDVGLEVVLSNGIGTSKFLLGLIDRYHEIAPVVLNIVDPVRARPT